MYTRQAFSVTQMVSIRIWTALGLEENLLAGGPNKSPTEAGKSSLVRMYRGVSRIAKRDQVLLRVIAGLASEIFVVDLKLGHCAARLASPAVAIEHLVAETVVLVRLKLRSELFGRTKFTALSRSRGAEMSASVRRAGT